MDSITMTPAMLTDQRQLRQRPDRAISTQHRIGQFEQHIRPTGQTPVKLGTEPGQIPGYTAGTAIVHTDQLKPLV